MQAGLELTFCHYPVVKPTRITTKRNSSRGSQKVRPGRPRTGTSDSTTSSIACRPELYATHHWQSTAVCDQMRHSLTTVQSFKPSLNCEWRTLFLRTNPSIVKFSKTETHTAFRKKKKQKNLVIRCSKNVHERWNTDWWLWDERIRTLAIHRRHNQDLMPAIHYGDYKL